MILVAVKSVRVVEDCVCVNGVRVNGVRVDDVRADDVKDNGE